MYYRFSIVNSCVTVLLLTGFLATILMRVLKNDFLKYTRDDDAAEEAEETGWKYIHGDVFRFPRHGELISYLDPISLRAMCLSPCVLFYFQFRSFALASARGPSSSPWSSSSLCWRSSGCFTRTTEAPCSRRASCCTRSPPASRGTSPLTTTGRWAARIGTFLCISVLHLFPCARLD